MICTTIQNRDLKHIYEALEQCEMAEIRLDRCALQCVAITNYGTAIAEMNGILRRSLEVFE